MEVRVERFDEVSKIYDVTEVTMEQGCLKLWQRKLRPTPDSDRHVDHLMIAMFNSGSWSACIDTELEDKYSVIA